MITTHKQHAPVYQSVIEKTRGLAFRTQVLGTAMNRRAAGEPHDGGRQQEGGGRKEGGGERRGGRRDNAGEKAVPAAVEVA
jgi:translation initiation factor 3 subunit E